MRTVRWGLIGAGAAMLIGSGPPAQAGYIVTLEQVGSNVVATGSGTINLADLSLNTHSTANAQVIPSIGLIFTGLPQSGPGQAPPIDLYQTPIGPTSFGSGSSSIIANSGSGDTVGIWGDALLVGVPLGYVSGNPLSDTATWDNASFSSLGVTAGTYVWTWGSGATADSFTLNAGVAAVPSPSIGRGLPLVLAVGGVLFSAKLLERSKKHRLQFA